MRIEKHPRTGQTFRIGALFTVLLAVFGPGELQAGLDSGPWPMFHRNAKHTGFIPLGNPLSPNLSWVATLSDTVEYSSPIVSSLGRIYIGDVGKELWSYDLSGGYRWDYHTGGNLRYGTPAIAEDQTIYVGSANDSLYALNPNGTLKWGTQAGGAVKTAPAIGDDGTIYFGADDGSLYAVHPDDGSVIWTYPATDTIRSSPAVASDGTIYFGSNDGFIRAVYPGGSLRWEGATGGPIKGAPAIFRDRVVVASGDGFIYQLDRRTGDLQWATYTGHNLRSSPAIGVTGKVYVGVDNLLNCYRDDDGQLCDEYPTGGRIFSSPAVTAGPDSLDIVVCGSDDGFLYAIKDEALLWRAFVGSPIRSSPAITPAGLVYVGAMNGRLYAFGDLSPANLDFEPNLELPQIVAMPNPAAPNQEITVHVPEFSRLPGDGSPTNRGSLGIYNLAGRRIDSFTVTPGAIARWGGHDRKGDPVPPGVYFLRWTNGTQRLSTRVIRLR